MSKLYGFAVIIVSCILAVATTVNGEELVDLHGDAVFPGTEQYYGMIDDFEVNGEREDLIVINDSIYAIHPDAVFRNRAGGRTGLSTFQQGMAIGYYAKGNTLTKMWDAGEMEESMAGEGSATSPEQPASGDQVRQVDGVWTN